MKKRLRLFSLLFFSAVFLLLTVLFSVIYFNQNSIVQRQLNAINDSFSAKLSVGHSHLALFENFPYISLKVDSVQLFETKEAESKAILDVGDIYLGFQFWDILKGDFDIQSLIIEEGVLNIVLHPDGTTNIERAIARESQEESKQEALNIHLKDIELRKIEFHQYEEASGLDISTDILYAQGAFQSEDAVIRSHLDTEFNLHVLKQGDTTYFNRKHFEFHTDLVYDLNSGILNFKPSGITMEQGDFEIQGNIDTKNEMKVDFDITGTKPSFDMLIAFAPKEVIPFLERYDNAGKIYFRAKVEGPTTEGRQPFIEANFGASEAFVENKAMAKRIDHMGFSGYFSNGEARGLSTMVFTMKDISASLEQGEISGSLSVRNFEEPDIDMRLKADFQLGFWAAFLNLKEVEELQGQVALEMRFHDIIDLDQPQRALDDLNQAYYTRFQLQDFALSSPQLPAPISDLDLKLEVNGKKASLDELNLVLGNSQLAIQGYLDDFPSMVHSSEEMVKAHLEISSKNIDLKELSRYSANDSTGINEKLSDLSLKFSFEALGSAFHDFKTLPHGEFFIDELYLDLQQYPHTLHDFHAGIIVKDNDLKVIDFTGSIDTSNFHLNGIIKDYSFWDQAHLHGEVALDLSLRSNYLRFNDLMTYGGVNYLPPEYRRESIEDLDLHLLAQLEYDSSQVEGLELELKHWAGKMELHPLRFENFKGRFQIDQNQLKISDFSGSLGRSDFSIDLNYAWNEKKTESTGNYFKLSANRIDFDELFRGQLETEKNKPEVIETKEDSLKHAEAFNLFDLPFADLNFELELNRVNYHQHELKNLKAQFHTLPNHHVIFDTLHLEVAGGEMAFNGEFNGSDPKHIFFKPNLKLNLVDLDQLALKFENLGQDHSLSENLHGELSAQLRGEIRIYPDLIPDLDQSEIHLDAQIYRGRLENYKPLLVLSDYLGNRNLNDVRFDTIVNHVDLKDGVLKVPNMTIESTLGHLELSGQQDLAGNLNYLVRVPWRLVREAAKNKLFGSGSPQEQEEIIKADPTKKTSYLNLSVVGTLEDYEIKMGKRDEAI